jgi:DNA polymerase I-like protein with 3'-5' exonuclease and polymerase domains
MIDVDDAGHKPQLVVHDDLNESSPSISHAKELAEIMVNAMEFSVPHVVDIECGPSWGEVELVK